MSKIDSAYDKHSTNSQRVFRKLRMQITAIVTIIVIAVLVVVFAGITASEYNMKTQVISIQLGNAIARSSSLDTGASLQEAPSYDIFSEKNHSNIFNGDSWFEKSYGSDNSDSENIRENNSPGASSDSGLSFGNNSSKSGTKNISTRIGRDSSFKAEAYFPIVTYLIDYDTNSLVSTNGDSSAVFSNDALSTATLLACDAGYGFVIDDDAGLCFLKQKARNGEDYVAFTDSSSIVAPMTSLISTFILVTLIVSIALMVVAWVASGWIIEPARDAWRKQTRFVADASHELKTPVSVIIANSALILDKKDLDDETRKWTAMTLAEANNLKNLVADMLYLATNEDEKGKEREILDIGHELTRVAMQFETRAFERGNDIDYTNIDENVSVLAERQGLNRVFSILLDNACKYSDSNTTITVRMKRVKKSAVIDIVDVGTGIPRGEEDAVFDRFFRADKSRTRENSYGLGLAMARDIVLKHNGTIEAFTAPDGRTTTFTVIMPVITGAKTKKIL